DSADSTRVLLERLGHRVNVALGGAEGVAAARRSPPDVVLCDLGLPGMSGYDVAAALRGDPRTRSIALVALSRPGSEADHQRCQAAGLRGLLVKPVHPAVLGSTLASLAATAPDTA